MVSRGIITVVGMIAIAGIALIGISALADHYVMQIGSKSNPNAHLFAYDQKFRESTRLQNYFTDTSASKEFNDATRLATRMELLATPNLTDMQIDADFIGTGMIGYRVLDPETKDVKEEQARIDHMFVGNFSIDEHIKVVKDHMCECGYLPCA
ncbi:MAG: hypothetical protein A4E48_00199 [Methanosaeta sp. PtaU1.Bin060]|jgi:hypothetical protein|nr:MAG: hypothetical protein A4E48_00199 [Methanosaeta sp. PtaU1.Bin060]